MDSIWRMQVVRENATKRDIWKRCACCPSQQPLALSIGCLNSSIHASTRLRKKSAQTQKVVQDFLLSLDADSIRALHLLRGSGALFVADARLGGSCRKVEQVSEEADHLKTALDKYGTRERRYCTAICPNCFSVRY